MGNVNNSDLRKVLSGFLTEENEKAINAHKGELSSIASSKEGKKVLNSLSTDTIKNAVKSGDMDTVMGEISKVLSTAEGGKFYAQINDIFGKKG